MSRSSQSHNRINLSRILSRLENVVVGHQGSGTEPSTRRDANALQGKSWWDVRRLSEDAKYARDLLDSVAKEEEGTGEGTSTNLVEYEALLNRISMALVLAQPLIPSLSHTPNYTLPPIPQTFSPSPAGASSMINDPAASNHTEQPDIDLLPPDPPSPNVTTFRDALPPPPSSSAASTNAPRRLSSVSITARDQLIPSSMRKGSLDEEEDTFNHGLEDASQQENKGDVEKEGGIVGSTSRLHDELTEQLAQMSVQLRKNALHFSQSLEAEKPLLEQGSALLESNFTRMTNSALRLGGVSTAGRSNTWIVLGACLVVGLAWLWMYLIIRMT